MGTVIGGLGLATLLTLVVIPVVYTIFEDWGDILVRYRKNRRNRGKQLKRKEYSGYWAHGRMQNYPWVLSGLYITLHRCKRATGQN